MLPQPRLPGALDTQRHGGSSVMPEKLQNIAAGTSYATSGSTFLIGGLTANEVAAVGGLLLAFATFLVNWYYAHRRMLLEEAARSTENDDVS